MYFSDIWKIPKYIKRYFRFSSPVMDDELILSKLDELGLEVNDMKINLRDVSDKVTELENEPEKVNIDERNTDQSDTKSKARGFSNIHYRLDLERDDIHIGHRSPKPRGFRSF